MFIVYDLFAVAVVTMLLLMLLIMWPQGNQSDSCSVATPINYCRYLLNDACVKWGKPLVSGSALRFEGQVCHLVSSIM